MPNPITITNLGKALVCFERTLLATDSPFDQYMRSNTSALIDQQVQGMQAFVQSGCANYHSGSMLSERAGRGRQPQNTTSDTGANGTCFRKPSLRNVVFTAPCIYSGTLSSLSAVLYFYDPGRGGGPSKPLVSTRQRDPQFPTRVTNKQAIVAFLTTSYDRTVPAAVPCGLPVGGNIH